MTTNNRTQHHLPSITVNLYTEDTEINYTDLIKYFDDNVSYQVVVNNYSNLSTEGVLVVFGSTTKEIETRIPKENRLLILGECSSIRSYDPHYLNQFGKVIGANKVVKPNHQTAP